MQDQMVSALDVNVPPNIDQVSILAIHGHRRKIASSSLYWLVSTLVLPPLFFTTCANPERLDVELEDVLQQELGF